MRIRVLFGSNSEIYRVPCDENEKTVDVIKRAIEAYKKCQEKENHNVFVKHLKTEQGDIIIVDDSKIKNISNHNQALTGMAIPVVKFSREGYKIRNGFG